MIITLEPGVQKFIEEQIKAGKFHSAEAVLHEAVNRMMLESEPELDEQTVDAINRGEEQLDRGEGIEFEQFAADWRKQIAAR